MGVHVAHKSPWIPLEREDTHPKPHTCQLLPTVSRPHSQVPSPAGCMVLRHTWDHQTVLYLPGPHLTSPTSPWGKTILAARQGTCQENGGGMMSSCSQRQQNGRKEGRETPIRRALYCTGAHEQGLLAWLCAVSYGNIPRKVLMSVPGCVQY